MITSIRHKGLKRFFESGSSKGIKADHERRLQLMLTALDTAATIDDMDIPGYRLHPLKGKMKDRWSVSVSGQWRLTFQFDSGNVEMLDYEDYH